MGTYQRGRHVPNQSPRTPHASGRVYHRSAKPRQGVARTFGESADWSDHQGCEALYTNKIVDLLKCLRPGQWVKNVLLLAAPFFAYFDRSQVESMFVQGMKTNPFVTLATLGLALAAFVLISAATYVVNDLHDLKADSKHPLKQKRPIVARKVSFGAAIPLAVLCLGGGFSLAAWVGMRCESMNFLFVCGGYCVLQLAYTFFTKQMADVGVILLATGFLLRAVAGAVVAQVHLSSWLMLCVFVGALFVALCKRRSTFFMKGQPVPTTNEPRILDFEIGIAASVTVACYALYTLSPQTVAHFGTENLIYTLPLVVLGIFRYVRLTYQEQRAGVPESLFFRDPILILSGILWVASCGFILGILA